LLKSAADDSHVDLSVQAQQKKVMVKLDGCFVMGQVVTEYWLKNAI